MLTGLFSPPLDSLSKSVLSLSWSLQVLSWKCVDRLMAPKTGNIPHCLKLNLNKAFLGWLTLWWGQSQLGWRIALVFLHLSASLACTSLRLMHTSLLQVWPYHHKKGMAWCAIVLPWDGPAHICAPQLHKTMQCCSPWHTYSKHHLWPLGGFSCNSTPTLIVRVCAWICCMIVWAAMSIRTHIFESARCTYALPATLDG